MTHPDITDDGFRVTEIGAYRWRVNPFHEAEAVRAIRRRWKYESSVGDACRPALAGPEGPEPCGLGASRGITIASK